MDPLTRLLMQGAAGAGGEGLGIEDVFSTWLYTGTGATQTITNGIDLAGEGGMVWIKTRDSSVSHALFDTSRGANRLLSSNGTSAETSTTGSTNFYSLSAFGATGFDLGPDQQLGWVNGSGAKFASWTFRKAPGFFDVVTYTGDGTGFFGGREVSHNLQGLPGCIIIKRTDSTSHWCVAFRKDASSYWVARPNNPDGILNGTGGFGNSYSNSFVASSTAFKPAAIDSGQGVTNVNGATYVAYLFAHDEQIFGEGGDQSVIKCGSYTGTGSNVLIDLGWEPQWLMVKRASATTGNASQDSWHIINNMSGITATVNGNSPSVKANTSDAENVYGGWGSLDPRGFYTGADVLNSGQTFIYIAIRRGPMKTPTDATEVFNSLAVTGSAGTTRTVGFPADLIFSRIRNTSDSNYTYDRLRGFATATNQTGKSILFTQSANAEVTNYLPHLYNIWNETAVDGNAGSGNSNIHWNFRRAPGFFDVVAYTGIGGTSTYSIPHNLGVVPEMVLVKRRDAGSRWLTYHSGAGSDKFVMLDAVTFAQSIDSGNMPFNNGNFSTTTFDVRFSSGYATEYNANVSGGTYIAYLFATCPGVSKVGSYTGTGTTLNVDCGFTSGARFVLIKRTDSTGGDWYVWDTARGIVSGNDPYLLLNSTAAEVTSTDYIDPLSSGFQISSSAPAAINASGGSYIFLAIA